MTLQEYFTTVYEPYLKNQNAPTWKVKRIKQALNRWRNYTHGPGYDLEAVT